MGAGNVFRYDYDNVYRYDYDNVAEEFVWRTVHDWLPALQAAIAYEIARLGES